MNKEDVYYQVAMLHVRNIDHGFLASLGSSFLAEMYRAMSEAKDAVLLTEEREGRIVGFVSGGASLTQIYRRMLRRPASLMFSLLPAVVKPEQLRRIFEVLRYARTGTAGDGLPSSELLSIAVAPEARGCGVAETLYRRLEAHFYRQGIEAFRITVGDGLVPAHRFYQKMGAVAAGRIELHSGQGSTVYVQSIYRPPGASDD